MILVILYHLNAKLSIRRDGTARASAGGGSVGGEETKEFSQAVRLAAAGFGLRAEESTQRTVLPIWLRDKH